MAFRDGSVDAADGPRAMFLVALAIVFTAMRVGGLLYRDERHIGFEGVAMLATYGIGVITLTAV